MNDYFLQAKLDERKRLNALRSLSLPLGKVDFCSNDYLGIVKNKMLDEHSRPDDFHDCLPSGSTGSRLLAGNYELIEEVEKIVAAFHDAETGLIFNSGYDANLGLLSSVPQRGDTVIYDYLSHASLRDGIRLSLARAFSFEHNNPDDLEKKLKAATGNIFVVTESVFSMDGDQAPLEKITDLCKLYNANLVVDEAHATGVVGERGEGLVQSMNLQSACFARIHTFGKACGAHGAIVLGSGLLRDYLVNFSRAFIYTTALPAQAVAAIKRAYEVFPSMNNERLALKRLIKQFQSSHITYAVPASETPVQVVIIPGNEAVKKTAAILQEKNFDVRPILYPSVPKGAERLRIVLHAFNTGEEVASLVKHLNG